MFRMVYKPKGAAKKPPLYVTTTKTDTRCSKTVRLYLTIHADMALLSEDLEHARYVWNECLQDVKGYKVPEIEEV